MARVTEMRYPNGWVEYYTYDAMGRILKVEDTHPSEKPAKTQKHTYRYDANGNMTYEYMRGNGTGQAKNETLYTYDALNRLITAHDNYGNSTRTYTYDSLGNLTYETGVGSHNCDYIYNNLNQQIDRSSDGWKSHTTSAYDNRGNLVLEEYIKNKKVTTAGAYTYDETNKMVRGVNGNAEESIYTYNGLGALMEQTWIIAKNGYGYHDVSATAVVDGEVVVDSVTGKRQQKVRLTPEELEAANAAAEAAEAASAEGNITETTADANTVMTAALVAYGNAGNGNNGNNGNGNGTQDKPTGSDVKNTSTVVKQFVVDFSSETYKPLMEHEVNGLDYRYVYSDKARLSVVVQGIENGSASLLDDAGELHAYYHCDYLGTTDYLTSAVNSKVISWTSYSEWGEITHNAVLKCGARELDLVKEYATHDFDAVLNMYYAKARFYDADNRRFVAVDPILDPSRYDLREYVTDPMQLVQYLYVKDNAVNWIDPDGNVALATAASAVAVKVGEALVAGLLAYLTVEVVEKYVAPAVENLARALSVQVRKFVATGKETVEDIRDYFEDISCGIKAGIAALIAADKVSTKQQSWEDGTHTVYVHYNIKNDEVCYVGRTNDYKRRRDEHIRSGKIGGSTNRVMMPVQSGLTKDQARVREQVLIVVYSLDALSNMRYEYSQKNWLKAKEQEERLIELAGCAIDIEDITWW